MINSPAAPKIDADKRSINCAASHRLAPSISEPPVECHSRCSRSQTGDTGDDRVPSRPR